MRMSFRAPFDYDGDAASDESALRCEDVSLAKQEFAEECDINTIVTRFGLNGELPENVAMPQSGDFTTVTDYKTAADMIAAANSAFMEMPAHVRARFDNDPAKFVDFFSRESNRDEARELGLLVPAVASSAAGSGAAPAAPVGAASPVSPVKGS